MLYSEIDYLGNILLITWTVINIPMCKSQWMDYGYRIKLFNIIMCYSLEVVVILVFVNTRMYW